MTDAVFEVVQSGPLVSIQDGGRQGFLRYGVTSSGPMDRTSFQMANKALGNQSDKPAIEISLSGLTLKCVSGEIAYASAGGGFILDDGVDRFGSWSIRTIKFGQTLTIGAGPWGAWTYLAFGGDVKCERWLGSAATHTQSKLGGGLLSAGDTINITDAKVISGLPDDIACPIFARPRSEVRIVMGPQDHHFEDEALENISESVFNTTGSYDRMGMRLNGAKLSLKNSLSIPSEPIIRGSIQVSGDGVPTVLMAEHQTTGGYPKIATVISSDLDGFAQLRPNKPVAFQPISPQRAIQIARMRAGCLARDQ